MKKLLVYSGLILLVTACGNDRHYPYGSSPDSISHPHDVGTPSREENKDDRDEVYEGNVEVPSAVTNNDELDALAIVDTRFFPNATVEDLEEKLAWFDDLMRMYFGVSTKLVSPTVFTSSAEGEGDLDFADRVIHEHLLPYPEYVILFSYGYIGDGRRYGGYFAGRIDPGGSYCNEFRALDNNSLVPVAIVDLNHLFARCGYDYETMERVSSTSFDGECRGVDGIQCVWTGDYFACEDRLGEPDINQDRFTARTVVHEFLHNWGADHACTPACEAELGSCDVGAELAEEFSQSPCTIWRFQNSFASCE